MLRSIISVATGSKHVKRFRSPQEFIPHAYWLIKDQAQNRDACQCKYCIKTAQSNIAEAPSISHRTSDAMERSIEPRRFDRASSNPTQTTRMSLSRFSSMRKSPRLSDSFHSMSTPQILAAIGIILSCDDTDMTGDVRREYVFIRDIHRTIDFVRRTTALSSGNLNHDAAAYASFTNPVMSRRHARITFVDDGSVCAKTLLFFWVNISEGTSEPFTVFPSIYYHITAPQRIILMLNICFIRAGRCCRCWLKKWYLHGWSQPS